MAGQQIKSLNLSLASPMPSVGIRTHFVIFGTLILIFFTSASITLWHRTKAQNELEASISHDFALHETLPDLRRNIRRIFFLTEAYLDNGNEEMLRQRNAEVADTRKYVERLKAIIDTQKVGHLVPELQRHFSASLELQANAIRKRKFRSFSKAEVLDGSNRDSLNTIIELMDSIGDAAIFGIRRRSEFIETASWHTFLSRIGIELGVALFFALYLYYFIIRPITFFQETMTHWKLGEVWPNKSISAIPEINYLFAKFSELTLSLSEQYKKEKDLNDFKSKLVSLVSHEFGNALTIIRNATSLLEERATTQQLKDNGPLFHMIISNTQLIGGAVGNLLNMARIEAGKLAINFTETNIGDILRSTVDRQDLLSAQKKIHVSIQLPDLLHGIRADAAALSLVCSNLMSNAIKYTPENGRINVGVVKLKTSPETYRVYFEDTGIGISSDDRTKILSGYYRTQRGQKMTTKGFGIGLSLARQIIEAHGSVLELESGPGKGSRFSFILPAWSESQG